MKGMFEYSKPTAYMNVEGRDDDPPVSHQKKDHNIRIQKVWLDQYSLAKGQKIT